NAIIAQMIFLDTPGLLAPRDMLQRSMLLAAEDAVREADVILLVLDASLAPDRERTDRILSVLGDASTPVVVAVNKMDIAPPGTVAAWEAWAEGTLGPAAIHRISALRQTGLSDLEEDLRENLPESPFLYPPEDMASEPVRFFVAELIRETVFEQFREEIPYSVFTRIEEYRASQDPVYIGATIYVERRSQKGILVGKGGRAIRDLGRAARSKIEGFIGQPVYLDLWVKVLPGWRRKRDQLQRLGFQVPGEHDGVGA
ncbi:MAG: GTPase Era, partial [Longimicrobiales bacterium]